MDVVNPGHRPVSIDRDGHQVEYGGCATEDVEGDPHVADLTTEEPLRTDVLDGRQRHDQDGDEKVGHRQRGDQIVGHVLKVALQDDGGDDEDVADDCRQDDQSEDGAG